jgi:hypothetical protein
MLCSEHGQYAKAELLLLEGAGDPGKSPGPGVPRRVTGKLRPLSMSNRPFSRISCKGDSGEDSLRHLGLAGEHLSG